MKRLLVISLVLILVLVGCKDNEGVEISDVWARPGIEGGNSGVFFLVKNHTDEEIKIVSADSDISNYVEVHKSYKVDDVMKMEKQDFVVVGAGAELAFKPGSYHIMVIDLLNDLNVGYEFEVTIQFENQPEQTIQVTVTEP